MSFGANVIVNNEKVLAVEITVHDMPIDELYAELKLFEEKVKNDPDLLKWSLANNRHSKFFKTFSKGIFTFFNKFRRHIYVIPNQGNNP